MGATLTRRSICFIQRILFAIAGPVKCGSGSESGAKIEPWSWDYNAPRPHISA